MQSYHHAKFVSPSLPSAAAYARSASDESTEQLAARLRKNQNVVSVMPNYIMTFASAQSLEYRTNDKYYGLQ